MLDRMGDTQKRLLTQLLRSKSGATIDELTSALTVSRNAIRQHLAVLQSDGLVRKAATRASGGRPEQLFGLTDKGHECFPRHYTWFAQLLLDSVQHETGPDALTARLDAMGTEAGVGLLSRHPHLRDAGARLDALADIMAQLGYGARAEADPHGHTITVHNCVFHALARDNPAICQFDRALLTAFSGIAPEHQACMASGAGTCRFQFAATPAPAPAHAM
jgi:predicted ArsR family transcriptional regulator